MQTKEEIGYTDFLFNHSFAHLIEEKCSKIFKNFSFYNPYIMTFYGTVNRISGISIETLYSNDSKDNHTLYYELPEKKYALLIGQEIDFHLGIPNFFHSGILEKIIIVFSSGEKHYGLGIREYTYSLKSKSKNIGSISNIIFKVRIDKKYYGINFKDVIFTKQQIHQYFL